MDVESGTYEDPIKLKPSSGVSVHEADAALRLGKAVIMLITYDKVYCYRVGFIRKVYGILTAQLLLTMVVCAVCQLQAAKDIIQGR